MVQIGRGLWTGLAWPVAPHPVLDRATPKLGTLSSWELYFVLSRWNLSWTRIAQRLLMNEKGLMTPDETTRGTRCPRHPLLCLEHRLPTSLHRSREDGPSFTHPPMITGAPAPLSLMSCGQMIKMASSSMPAGQLMFHMGKSEVGRPRPTSESCTASGLCSRSERGGVLTTLARFLAAMRTSLPLHLTRSLRASTAVFGRGLSREPYWSHRFTMDSF